MVHTDISTEVVSPWANNLSTDVCVSVCMKVSVLMCVFSMCIKVPDGSAYDGEWADGLRDGRGTLYLSSGDSVKSLAPSL
jgi:hypothetical protein